MKFEQPEDPTAPKPIRPKDLAYLSHRLLYGLHMNPRKCENYKCPKCEEIHLCPSLN